MCDFDPRCDCGGDLVGNALTQIASGHWSVTAVYGDDEHAPFAYTTGLIEFDRPELVITGMDLLKACVELNEVAGRLIGDADHLASSSAFPYIPVEVIDSSDLRVTRLLYGPAFAAVQLAWPDASMAYPWDRAYPADRRQPLLGIPLPHAA
ncbi:MAG: DUF4262 domain-containing protein [Gordonia sp. (in: high G+C Gram-positive bacteria)]|uniref:DUF4262 domain-containing protein n=1 Tax=Gordonia sp. (in: high G+C Gram-positive bacteria) TaxID=84139 RepID=UPI0039E6EE79